MSKAILVIDDSASVRQMVKRILEQVGYEVVEAGNGKEGFEKAKLGMFDAILTDQNMPEMDGMALTRNLRKIQKFNTTPVIFMTTESSDSMKQLGRESGASGWLMKPFDPVKLVNMVKKVTPLTN